MRKACEKFSTPVTGSNVSFYNQSSDEGPVFPTPTIGMLGLMENPALQMTLDFKGKVTLFSWWASQEMTSSSSQYLYSYRRVKGSPAPYFDIDEEYQVQQVIKSLIAAKVIQSAHDVSDGGLFAALAESAMPRCLGFNINPDRNIRLDAFLFGESQSVVVSVKPEMMERFAEMVQQAGVSFSLLGKVHAGDFRFDEKTLMTSSQAKRSL